MDATWTAKCKTTTPAAMRPNHVLAVVAALVAVAACNTKIDDQEQVRLYDTRGNVLQQPETPRLRLRRPTAARNANVPAPAELPNAARNTNLPAPAPAGTPKPNFLVMLLNQRWAPGTISAFMTFLLAKIVRDNPACLRRLAMTLNWIVTVRPNVILAGLFSVASGLLKYSYLRAKYFGTPLHRNLLKSVAHLVFSTLLLVLFAALAMSETRITSNELTESYIKRFKALYELFLLINIGTVLGHSIMSEVRENVDVKLIWAKLSSILFTNTSTAASSNDLREDTGNPHGDPEENMDDSVADLLSTLITQ